MWKTQVISNELSLLIAVTRSQSIEGTVGARLEERTVSGAKCGNATNATNANPFCLWVELPWAAGRKMQRGHEVPYL